MSTLTKLADPAEAAAAPDRFTREFLGWEAWLPPLDESDLTECHHDALVDRARAKSDYFRLLARDPEVLKARTLADKDIFQNDVGHLPRPERELAATAVSRVNGCIYCASVHARFAATWSKRTPDLDLILAQGVSVDLGTRWNAIVAAAAALTTTPITFGPAHVTQLGEAGLDTSAIVDLVQSAAFFSWANRLMLSLGAPTLPDAPE